MQTFKACGLDVLDTVAPAVLALAILVWELTDTSQRTNNNMLIQDDGDKTFLVSIFAKSTSVYQQIKHFFSS